MYNKRIFKRCFCWPKRYWYKNIKNIPLYFKLMNHLIKYGYDEYATWETFDWFINTMKPILIEYKKNHTGVPALSGSDPLYSDVERDSELWDSILDEMLSLLDDMNENNPKYESADFTSVRKSQEEAKNRFFELFSKHFYNLWD